MRRLLDKILSTNRQALVAGLALFAVGLFGVWEGQHYSMGQLSRIGPGFFVVVLGVTLAGFGIAVILENDDSEESRKPAPLRATLAIFGSILAFALIVENGGVVPATLATVIIASLGDRNCGIVVPIISGVVLSVAAVVLFIYGLGVPLRPFWW